ncbi:MAG: thioredoxin family protein [Candidatus Bathyarchaeota archaeon]|nr:thioredoxin family protein [Candidatus Bathyarchaeota archaeon]
MIDVGSEEEWRRQIKVHSKVVAVFYESYCPFCRRFLPVFHKYAQQSSSITFMSVNMDDYDDPLWEEYEVVAVPSVIFFEKGQVAKRLDCALGVGLSEEQFSRWLAEL